MNFDSISYESSLQSDDENKVGSQINKTKTQQTKFFSDLNRQQKFMSKKMMSQIDNQKKSSNNKKNRKLSPTLQQMIRASKKHLQDENSRTLGSRKKVRFDKVRQNLQDKRSRKPSIQKNSVFNFYDSIKQMAIVLTQSRMNCQYQKSQDQNTQKTNQSLFTGYTEKEFQDGTKFKGLCQNGVIIKGELHFQNGFIYEGQLFLDKFHGKGKITLPKNQVIEADWIQGEIVGKATIKYPKGQIYYGDVKQFRRHGKGHLFFNDGSKYEGDFNEGQLTGYGIHITTQGQKTSGYWFYGDFIGSNEQVFENVMSNAAAHEKKKSQKQNKNIKLSKGRSSRKSKNLFAELFLNIENLA